MKNFVKILSLVLSLTMMVGVLAGCGGNEPAKDENQTDFYIMGGMSPLSAGYDSNVVLNELAENAGITIEWDTMSDSLAEQVNIRIAGEQLPECRLRPACSCGICWMIVQMLRRRSAKWIRPSSPRRIGRTATYS